MNPAQQLLHDITRPPTDKPLVTLVMGKGGVGKTTVSIVLADLLSQRAPTLLASLDQAMHLLEYLDLPVPMKHKKINLRLTALQVDASKLVRQAATEYANTLRSIMPGLTVLNLDDVLKTLHHNPGFEEEAYLRYITSLYQDKDNHYIIVDTPPTGTTYRILRLPQLYIHWTRQLTKLRERIVNLRYVIARTLEQHIEPRDPVLQKLRQLHQKYQQLHQTLTNPKKTRYIIVMTPEPLPLHETRNTIRFLQEMGTQPTAIIVNRLLPRETAEKLGTHKIQMETINKLKQTIQEHNCECSLYAILHHTQPPRTLEQARTLTKMITKL